MSEEIQALPAPTSEQMPSIPPVSEQAPALPPVFEETPVLSIDDSRTVQTDADEAKDDLLDLMESKQSRRILTGTIHGIEHAERSSVPIAVITHGSFKVIIPVQEAITPPEDYHGYPPDRVHEYMLSKRLGAEVNFIVKGIDVKGKLAVASMLEAMQRVRRHYYFAQDRDGLDLLRVDRRAEARVVSVIRSGIFVELFGLEVFVPMSELSYQRILDARDEFQPGQRVLVRILELDKSDPANIKAKLSVKQAKENPTRKAFERFDIGNVYIGTVTMIRTNGIYVSMDGGMDCLCKLSAMARPSRGTRVTVRILGKDEKRYSIWGTIIHIAGKI